MRTARIVGGMAIMSMPFKASMEGDWSNPVFHDTTFEYVQLSVACQKCSRYNRARRVRRKYRWCCDLCDPLFAILAKCSSRKEWLTLISEQHPLVVADWCDEQGYGLIADAIRRVVLEVAHDVSVPDVSAYLLAGRVP